MAAPISIKLSQFCETLLYLFIPEKPGEVFHDNRFVKVCEAELGCQVNHGDHSLLPDHRLSVKETILNLKINRKSQHILDSEGDILYRLQNENSQRRVSKLQCSGYFQHGC